MAEISLQRLPLDILLDILDCVEYEDLVPFATTCRALKVASETFLRQHSVVHLVNKYGDNYHGALSLGNAFKVLACNRWIARSIRKIEVKDLSVMVAVSRGDPDEVLRCLKQAIRFPPGTDESIKRIIGFNSLMPRRLFFIALLCENLESLSITAKDLDWLGAAEHLDYKLWPHSHLTHLEITWTEYKLTGTWSRKHDLQDIWLLLSAPTLKYIVLDGLQQGNNLYAGTSDRAAIRTTYWPIPLELWVLYQYNYQGAYAGFEHNPPMLLPSSPFPHEFKALETFVVRNFLAPGTWLPLMVSCLKSLRKLNIIYDDDKVNWDYNFCITFRLLNAALEQLASTLEHVAIEVAVHPDWPVWIKITQCGYFSIGSLHMMLHLRCLELPWFIWLPRGKSGGLSDVNDIKLPPNLETLVLGQCDAVNFATIVQLVKATISVRGSHLKRIMLRVNEGMALKVDDFSDLATEIEIVLETHSLSQNGSRNDEQI